MEIRIPDEVIIQQAKEELIAQANNIFNKYGIGSVIAENMAETLLAKVREEKYKMITDRFLNIANELNKKVEEEEQKEVKQNDCNEKVQA